MEKSPEHIAYNQWFIEQVELAVAEADDPNTEWVSNEQAKAEWAVKRASLRARIERLQGTEGWAK